jgi:hypothetical protein
MNQKLANAFKAKSFQKKQGPISNKEWVNPSEEKETRYP